MKIRLRAQTFLLLPVMLLVACATVQPAPTISLMPMPGDDPRWDTECRQWATSVTPPVTTGEGVVVGTLGGAGIGAAGGAIGGAIAGNTGKGAGIGAGIGGLLGLLGGLAHEARQQEAAQAYSNQAYLNCLNAKRAAAQQQRQIPPPPPRYQYAPPPPPPPPGAGQCRPSGKYVRIPDGTFREICE